MATRAADFPDEILVEIFTRLPARSIGKFRSLSKPWRKFLSSPQFIKSHLSRQKSRHQQQQQNLILLPVQSTYPYSLRAVETINDDDSTISRELDFPKGIAWNHLITCDGLILLIIEWRNIFLVNPITLEKVPIPSPPFEGEIPPREREDIFPIYGLGHDTVNDDYKVVLVCYQYHHSVYSLDVYSVKTGVWKRIESPPGRYTRPSHWPGASVNGAMHWLAVRNYQYGLIAALDIAKEVCFEIPAPSGVDVQYSSYLEVLGMCLCLIDHPINSTGIVTDVWIMKEYGVSDSWTKLFTFPQWGSDPYPVTVTLLCFIRDEEEVVLVKDQHLVVHNVKEGMSRNLVVDGVPGKILDGWTFVESLVSPKRAIEDYCAT